MKDKEIELKFVINAKIRAEIIGDLEKVAVKTSENRLIDTYYVPDFKNFEVDGHTVECVRIRENENGTVLAYKKIHKECNPVYCDEFETLVSSKDQMEKILFALGFSVQMVIDKIRVTYKFDDLEFDFDSVKGLGELLEVELKSNKGSVDTIYNYVSKYGLTKADVTYEGIQTLMKEAKK